MSKVAFLIAVLTVLNGYIGMRLIGKSPWNGGLIAWLILALLVVLQFMAPVGERVIYPILREKYPVGFLLDGLVWIGYLSFGVAASLFVYCFIADLVRLAGYWLVPGVSPVDWQRRTVLTTGLAAAGTAILGVYQAEQGPEICRVDVPLDKLPKSFDGFTIAQISDLHVGTLIDKTYVEKVVKQVAELKPDMIALTGDFVDGDVIEMQDPLSPLATLSAPAGIFYVTGNHEYYWGGDVWNDVFAKLGAVPLRNEHRFVERGNDRIAIAGVSDYSTKAIPAPWAYSPERAGQGIPSEVTKILLAHQPSGYERATAAGYDLQLSGHTHAGQFFPFNLLIGFFHRYYKGLNRHNDKMWIYVNKGTGYWGPPLRAGVPTEITLLTLRSKEG